MPATTRSADKKPETHDDKGDGQVAGTKHEPENKEAPSPKRSKKDDDKDKSQKTLEDMIPTHDQKEKRDSDNVKDAEEDVKKEDTHRVDNSGDGDGDGDGGGGGGAVEEGGRDEEKVASNILEKGLIYFFFRGRVNIQDPSSVQDVARSYFVLRPMAPDAKLRPEGGAVIQDAGNSRLLAVPKKVFPVSGRDRWLAFVEKSEVSFQTLKSQFLAGETYDTKTAGERHTPEAKPIAEGVYVMTTTGRESHLVYKITIPSDLGEVQDKMGLRETGSFILSTRNPDYPAPKNVALEEGPGYPQEIKDDFRALRWAPTKPAHLDYPNTQFLLIGEAGHVDEAVKEKGGEGEEDAGEELEKLGDEDTHRMKDFLGGEDDGNKKEAEGVLADLRVRSEGWYPVDGMQTTF